MTVTRSGLTLVTLTANAALSRDHLKLATPPRYRCAVGGRVSVLQRLAQDQAGHRGPDRAQRHSLAGSGIVSDRDKADCATRRLPGSR